MAHWHGARVWVGVGGSLWLGQTHAQAAVHAGVETVHTLLRGGAIVGSTDNGGYSAAQLAERTAMDVADGSADRDSAAPGRRREGTLVDGRAQLARLGAVFGLLQNARVWLEGESDVGARFWTNSVLGTTISTRPPLGSVIRRVEDDAALSAPVLASLSETQRARLRANVLRRLHRNWRHALLACGGGLCALLPRRPP